MASRPVRWRRFVSAALLASGCLAVAGCGGVRRIPVSGSVTLDGKPLDGGVLLFHPDESKGNTFRASCTGPVKNGRYKLITTAVTRQDTGAGAPLGWYKVHVHWDSKNAQGQPCPVHPRFLESGLTTLSLEVVANPQPGA